MERDRLLQAAFARARGTFNVSTMPFRWFSMLPVYPWRDVLTPDTCWRSHQHLLLTATANSPYTWKTTPQRVPGGSISWGSAVHGPKNYGYRGACTSIDL